MPLQRRSLDTGPVEDDEEGREPTNQCMPAVGGKGGGQHDAKFPHKVYKMIDYCDRHTPHIACWTHDGSAIVVKEPEKLATLYLERYKVCRSSKKEGAPKFQSFVRQLNLYGFRNISKEKDSENIMFSHENFRRGMLDLIDRILRKKSGDSERSLDESSGSSHNRGDLQPAKTEIQKKLESVENKLDRVNIEVKVLHTKIDELIFLIKSSKNACLDEATNRKRPHDEIYPAKLTEQDSCKDRHQSDCVSGEAIEKTSPKQHPASVHKPAAQDQAPQSDLLLSSGPTDAARNMDFEALTLCGNDQHGSIKDRSFPNADGKFVGLHGLQRVSQQQDESTMIASRDATQVSSQQKMLDDICSAMKNENHSAKSRKRVSGSSPCIGRGSTSLTRSSFSLPDLGSCADLASLGDESLNSLAVEEYLLETFGQRSGSSLFHDKQPTCTASLLSRQVASAKANNSALLEVQEDSAAVPAHGANQGIRRMSNMSEVSTELGALDLSKPWKKKLTVV